MDFPIPEYSRNCNRNSQCLCNIYTCQASFQVLILSHSFPLIISVRYYNCFHFTDRKLDTLICKYIFQGHKTNTRQNMNLWLPVISESFSQMVYNPASLNWNTLLYWFYNAFFHTLLSSKSGYIFYWDTSCWPGTFFF